jgi:hypothetical protein
MQPVIRRALTSPSKPLDSQTRSFCEPRFGCDFSKVRVHSGSVAAALAQSFGASAFTIGNDVVFGSGQFEPATDRGRHLLAHELTHVAQQSDSESAVPGQSVRWSSASEEAEADIVSHRVVRGREASVSRRTGGPALARFSDTTHHVIEEAALTASGFTPAQTEAIEKGNIQRDYSQLGAVANTVLLGRAKGFGGYDPAEHFDNFIFDAVTNCWRTRGAGQQKFLHLDPKEPDTSPIDYICGQLTELASAGMTEASLVHLGNAFHTVEDFFAHSNFIELSRNDRSFGDDLVTGSFGDNPANSAVSLAHTLSAVSTPGMRDYYDRQAESQTKSTEPRSHSRLAKDTASSPGFAGARRLAALVIQDLGVDIIAIMRNPKPEVRTKLINNLVMAKIRRYLRPPEPKDPWWEALGSRNAGSIEKRLSDADSRTPVTVNQAAFSPLPQPRSVEGFPSGDPAWGCGAAGRKSFFSGRRGRDTARGSRSGFRTLSPATTDGPFLF